MLDLAMKYDSKLKELFSKVVFDEKYMFYNGQSWFKEYEVKKSTWDRHEFVSLDSNNNIIGFISYGVDRNSYNTHGFGAINFSDNIITFGKDVFTCFDEIFTKFKFRKCSYFVYIGNPIEKTYDKLTLKYGGRIIGTALKADRLMDGNYYDEKSYEIFREDYLRRKDELKYDKTTSHK